MTKIRSDPFKIPFNLKFYSDSESEIRFSKKPKKFPKTQKPRFLFRVFRPEFCSKTKKQFFQIHYCTIELLIKNSFEKNQKLIKIF